MKITNQIEIIKPNDFHVHFRDGEVLKAVVKETSKYFNKVIVMPNLIPPILSGTDAIKYKNKIEREIPPQDNFLPLMTVYLTENTNKEDLKNSYENKLIFAAKLYPAGATTNSESGIKNIGKIMPILETMSKIGMPLLIHGEVSDDAVDIFDREKIFIDKYLNFIIDNLPELKITLEHITTIEAVQFINDQDKHIAGSITPHHISLNRNSLFKKGIRPHNYCLPILKREKHRKAILKEAVTGNEKFFLGTDTAPHLIGDKENECGCAGIFNAPYCLPILAQIFDNEKSLINLEKFVSLNGCKHYNLAFNLEKTKIFKYDEPLIMEKFLNVKKNKIKIFDPGFPVFWNS